jgi:hypothetical protein
MLLKGSEKPGMETMFGIKSVTTNRCGGICHPEGGILKVILRGVSRPEESTLALHVILYV